MECEITTDEWLEWSNKASAIACRKDIISYDQYFDAVHEIDRLIIEAHKLEGKGIV